MTSFPDSTRAFIGGTWRHHEGRTIPVIDPATEAVIGACAMHGPEEVEAAVSAARAARAGWAATPAVARAAVLARLADLLDQHADELAEIIHRDVGTPMAVARAVQVGLPRAVCRTTSRVVEEALSPVRVGNSLVDQVPIGVVAAITPWNYPLHQSVAKIAAALAAGCTVVHKPSELAPLVTTRLAELIDEAGVPAGVYNQVLGAGAEVGAALVNHPSVDMVSFTGSTPVGRQIEESAGSRSARTSLELGGKSANIVLDDASLPDAVKAGVDNAMLNSGQTCSAWSRLLVPWSVHDEACALAAKRAAELDPRLGPLISQDHRERVAGFVQRAVDAGAQVVAGGPDAPARPEGWFAPPTVLANVDPGSEIAQEEVFGPVLVVLGYENDNEAVRIANDSRYGLSGAVWSASEDRAVEVARGLHTGQVDINGARFNPLAPFGGMKSSGTGRELGLAGIREFVETRSIQLPADSRYLAG